MLSHRQEQSDLSRKGRVTNKHTLTFPRRLSARVIPKPSAPKGRGNAGRRCTRRSLVCESVESTRVSHHEYAGLTRHSRTRMVLTAYGARPRRSLARCVSIVATRDASVEASGPHAFAVRKPLPFVARHGSRPPHPGPTFRDDREAPLTSGPGRREALGPVDTYRIHRMMAARVRTA